MRSRVPAIWFLRLSGWEHLEEGGGGEEEEERGGLFKVGFLRDIFPVLCLFGGSLICWLEGERTGLFIYKETRRVAS